MRGTAYLEAEADGMDGVAGCGATLSLFAEGEMVRLQVSDVAQQALSSMRTVRSFAMESFERARYDAAVNASYSIGAKRAAALGTFVGLVSAVAQVF